MQERKSLGRGQTLVLGRMPDFEAQPSPRLGNKAKERCPESLDPELLTGEGKPYRITHFSHGGHERKTHLKSYRAQKVVSLVIGTSIGQVSPLNPSWEESGLSQRQDFEDRTLRENNG